jgi:Negative regulator of sigma F
MSKDHEIDYAVLIDRSIEDFQPAKKLWPISLRLVLWVVLEAAILTVYAEINGFDGPSALIRSPGTFIEIGALALASIAAALLALRSIIPAREVSHSEVAMLIAVLCVAFVSCFPQFVTPLQSRELFNAGPHSASQVLGLAGLPWIVLFWAVRRGVPLQPAKTGGLVGVAAFCFGLAAYRLVSGASESPNAVVVEAISGLIVASLSAFAGLLWLNPVTRWRSDRQLAAAQEKKSSYFSADAAFPVAIFASIVALILVLANTRAQITQVRDFDLAIQNYHRSLTDFRPNVPSSSIEAVLTAYVENGMPAYMWDFGPEGFNLVGGRLERLPDGTPVTYTWFRGARGGIMCMFRQTDGFEPPAVAHEEHHHLLFYEYRGFSVCLINVGGYGNFISVIAAAMPMKEFVALVLAATLPNHPQSSEHG